MAMGTGWLLYRLTNSSVWVGASYAAIQAPSLVVAPLAGVLADRYDRRHVFAVSLALASAACLLLALLATAGLATPPVVLACTLLMGVTFSAQGTASSSLVPGLVPRTNFPNAVALLGTVRQGAEFVGPTLGSALIVVLRDDAVFYLAALCYFAGIALVLAMRAVEQPKRATSRPVQSLVEGIAYARAIPLLGSIILLVGFHCSLTMTYQGMLPQYADQVLMGNEQTYGHLMTAVGLGAIIGTLLLAAASDRRMYGTYFVVTAVLSGVALMCLGLVHAGVLAYLCALAVGGSQAAFMAISMTFLQENSDDAHLGRVTGVYSFLASGTMALLTYLLGWLAGTVSPAVLMVAFGCIFVVVLVVAARSSATIRLVYRGAHVPQLVQTA